MARGKCQNVGLCVDSALTAKAVGVRFFETSELETIRHPGRSPIVSGGNDATVTHKNGSDLPPSAS